MLNTDLHRANRNDSKRSSLGSLGNLGSNNNSKYKKMTKDEFINNLRGADQGSDINMDYLSVIYDNIKAHPIELPYTNINETNILTNVANSMNSNGKTNSNIMNITNIKVDMNEIDEKSFIGDITRTVHDAEDLLRSLSSYTYHFQLTGKLLLFIH